MKKLLSILIIIFSCSNSLLFATAQPNTFKMFPNKFFVETGSFMGDGIMMAYNARFPNIYSIELSENYYNLCKQKFAPNPNIKLFLGDSGDILYETIKNIDSPITFWLDGHYSGAPTAKGKSFSPVLQELEQIKKHPIKNHTILIDDVRLFGTIEFDYVTLEQIIDKILEINPNYNISFVPGYVHNDILVAQIK